MSQAPSSQAAAAGFTKLARIDALPLGTPFIFAYEAENHVPYTDTGHKVVVKTLSADKWGIVFIERERYEENRALVAAGKSENWCGFPWGWHLVQRGWVAPDVQEGERVWTLGDRHEARIRELAETLCSVLGNDDLEFFAGVVGCESSLQPAIQSVINRRAAITREVAS